jgi:DNA-binding Lrp family transcriptional regulator
MSAAPDPVDERILAELRANARISHAQLGTLVHLSRNAVRQRVERLERLGRIGGYTIVEPGAGPKPVRATMLVTRGDRIRDVAVLEALKALPEVVECDVVTGELDLVLTVEAATPVQIQQVWTQISALPGVRDITTAMSLATVIRRPARPA